MLMSKAAIILMISRLVLCVQYGTIIWHIRESERGKLPVAIAGAVHFVSAMIFLGIRFRFQEGRNSRVYIVWYIVSACEALIQLGLAKYYKVLTFSKTHLTERMTVLTVIILGAGVTSIAKNVVLIVKNAAGWSESSLSRLGKGQILIFHKS
jgi:low temperature requirement protein LtrA